MNKEIAEGLTVLADSCGRCLSNALRGMAKLLTDGVDVGSCPYCKRGTFVRVGEVVVSIGEETRRDCCCVDLVVPFNEWIEGDI